MNDALAAEKYRAVSLQKQVFSYVAQQYRDQSLAVHFEEDLSPAGVRELAEMIAGVCGGTAAVFSGRDGRFDVCLAHPGADVKELGTKMAKALNGRGGGKTGFFQGSIQATKGEIESFFRSI